MDRVQETVKCIVKDTVKGIVKDTVHCIVKDTVKRTGHCEENSG